MTTKERAEKVYQSWCEIDTPGEKIHERFVNDIAAQIDEAVREAFDNKWKNEHKRCIEIEYDKGYTTARDQAAGIVAKEAPSARENGYGFVADRFEYIAERIRAIEVGK